MNKLKSFFKAHNVVAFFALCMFVLAAIGGTAYLFYDGHVVFGICNVLLAVMAIPSALYSFNILIGNDDDID